MYYSHGFKDGMMFLCINMMLSSLSYRYMHSGLTGHSHCRNPNGLLRPWCYTNKNCEVDFCEVCGIGELYKNLSDLPVQRRRIQIVSSCPKEKNIVTIMVCGSGSYKNTK